MKAVAAGDEITVEPVHLAAVQEGDEGLVGVDVARLDAHAFKKRRRPRRRARLVKVARHFGLAIDDDMLAGQPLEIDPHHATRVGDVGAGVNLPLAIHPLAHPGLAQEPREAGFQHPGADA